MQPFVNAKSIFIKNKRENVNFQAGFKCKFNADKSKTYILKITGATLYSIWMNGDFIFYGPARAPHGYLRYDEILLNVSSGDNTLCVCLAGYNCPSFYTMDIKSFLRAEIYENGVSYKYTGKDFSAISLDKLREKEVYRFSYQRAFNEVWHFDNSDLVTGWMFNDFESEPLNTYTYEQELIPRSFASPKFDSVNCCKIKESGRFKKKDDFTYDNKRYIAGLNYRIKGFLQSEIKSKIMEEIHGNYFPDKLTDMCRNRYSLYDFERVYTGFIQTDIFAYEDSEIYFIFSETLKNGQPDSGIYGNSLQNIVKYTLAKSDKPYKLQSFEAYSFRYLTILVRNGKVNVEHLGICKYEYPLVENTKFECDDKELLKIFEAAKATYCQNTIDCFMDCPGRERGGWLCDSYFTAQAEQIFSGDVKVEEQFLKNFIMAKDIPGIDANLLPMCYPGDNNDVIPQWVMWYVLEVEQYLKRKKDNSDYFRKFCYNFLEYLSKHETETGLLRKLDGWNFIEWSDANEFVGEADISYPTNMLYVATLRAIGNIYCDEDLLKKSDRIKGVIIEKAFDGKYFCDGAVWENGQYNNMPSVSEACQYYAVFCKIADNKDKMFDEFFDNFLNKLGYKRKLDRENPQIAFSAVFIGYSLRLLCLQRFNEYDKLISEIKELYRHMADKTMTLWEDEEPGTSCNHGFSSIAGVLIIKALTGLEEINECEKIIMLHKNSCNVKYNISIGLENGTLQIKNDGVTRSVNITGEYKTVLL